MESDDLLGRDPGRRRVHSSLYADLRTNLPREVMGFSDFPNTPAALNGRSADPRRFPAHTEVLPGRPSLLPIAVRFLLARGASPRTQRVCSGRHTLLSSV